MSRLSKIFFAIIIILIITLGLMTYLYFHNNKLLSRSLEPMNFLITELIQKNEAIENAGLELEENEDGSYILVERKIPIERVD